MESCASKTLSDRHFLGLLLQAYFRISIVGIPETFVESCGRLRWRSEWYGYRGRRNGFHMKTGWETYLRFMRASISVCAVVVVTGVVFFEKFSFVVVEVVFRAELLIGGRWFLYRIITQAYFQGKQSLNSFIYSAL